MNVATIISVYGGDSASSFARALDSIFAQNFNEPIVSRVYLAVDGSLPDELWRVVYEKKSRIYKLIEMEGNRGLSVALNNLIFELEDEEFVFRMDSDDVAFPSRYQTQLDFFSENPEVDILGSDIIEIDESTGNERNVSFCRGSDNAFNNLSKGVPVAHPTVCFRRRVVDAMGGYPVSKTNEDVALWFECAILGFRFDNVPEPLLYFRISESFWKRRGVKKSFGELSCYLKGIWKLHGFTWQFIFPLLRFFFRLSPAIISKFFYGSKLRGKIRR